MKKISLLLGLLVVLPIWYYLLYVILVAINATNLTWFLFWVYVPVGMFVAVLSKLYEKE